MIRNMRTAHLSRKILLSFFLVLLFLATAIALIPLPEPLFPDNYSFTVLAGDGSLLRVFPNREDQWQLPPEDGGIPEKLVKSVIAFEDKRFFHHLGIDPLAVARALKQNLGAKKRVSGASTLTMQLARLLRPKDRTLGNKALEVLQAVKIELFLPKARILKLYLDHAPYGGNIRGYGTAAWKYFGKTPNELTWAEAAVLAVLPNSPSLVSPSSSTEALKQKRDRLLAKLKAAGELSETDLTNAVREQAPTAVLPFPLEAPHLAAYLKNQASTTRKPAKTFIDVSLQRVVTDLADRHAEELAESGIRNLAVVVAETESGKVRAYLGSGSFFDKVSQGQVDGLRAPRSTGSLLKPFLYGLAMDDGLLLPETQLKDIPSWFGAFSPTNANEKYSGLVTVREALALSLNVPAVHTLNRYGLEEFASFLKEAGLRHLFRAPQDYGLPLILGGAEASALEIGALYRGLGRFGRFAPLRLAEQDSVEEGQKLLSSGAASLVLDILKDVRRPGVDFYWRSFSGSRPLAWKTGTSYGQRDAWAAGVSPDWTIVVWAGNFEGHENPNLKSTDSAAPLLFDIWNLLSAKNPAKWFTPPEGSLAPAQVCAETGYRVGPDCPKTRTVPAPADAKPLPECPHHRALYVTLDERYRVTSKNWTPGAFKRIVRLVYPPDLAQFFRTSGRPLANLPPLLDGGDDGTPPLSILYPKNGAKFFLPRDLDGSLQKLLLRAGHQEKDARIFWYVDGAYLGETRGKHTMAKKFTRGWHRLALVDETGNKAEVEFYTELAGEGTNPGDRSKTNGR